jgi:hypothetical protein
MNEYQPGVNGITAADIEQAKREYERARFEEMQRITAEHEADSKRAFDLLERAKARVRRNSGGLGE